MTNRFYKNNIYVRELFSTINEIADGNLLVLDSTIFFPEGGGQACDFGEIEGLQVISVFEKNDKIYHKVEVENDIAKEAFSKINVGDKVHSILDWDRRFDHMQRHCGEHILSGIFFSKYKAVNKGFHMGDDYMTIDLDMQSVDSNILENVELLANKVIWSNVQVSIRYFDNMEQVSKLPLRKDLTVESSISIVTVGDLTHPVDCVACCGTHPATTGEVGLIKIFKAEKYKGMVRVFFEAGQRALKDYSGKHKILSELCTSFSSTPNELPIKINSKMEKYEDQIEYLGVFREIQIQREAEDLLEYISSPDESEIYLTPPENIDEINIGQIVIKEFDIFSIDDLAYLAKILVKSTDHLFILVSTMDNMALLEKNPDNTPNFPDLGILIKDYTRNKTGRGGGNKNSARISFENSNDLIDFTESIVDLI